VQNRSILYIKDAPDINPLCYQCQTILIDKHNFNPQRENDDPPLIERERPPRAPHSLKWVVMHHKKILLSCDALHCSRVSTMQLYRLSLSLPQRIEENGVSLKLKHKLKQNMGSVYDGEHSELLSSKMEELGLLVQFCDVGLDP